MVFLAVFCPELRNHRVVEELWPWNWWVSLLFSLGQGFCILIFPVENHVLVIHRTESNWKDGLREISWEQFVMHLGTPLFLCTSTVPAVWDAAWENIDALAIGQTPMAESQTSAFTWGERKSGTLRGHEKLSVAWPRSQLWAGRFISGYHFTIIPSSVSHSLSSRST